MLCLFKVSISHRQGINLRLKALFLLMNDILQITTNIIKMKTLSQGRKTPINNYEDLSYCRKSVSYIRQSREEILNAKNFYDLQNDCLMIENEQTIQLLLRLSNCTTTTDLFCALSYDYLNSSFKKLNLFEKSKWIFERNIKGIGRRIVNDNDFGIDYVDLLSGTIKNKRFTLRKEWTHSLRMFSPDDITLYTNEEMYLHFDALQIAQQVEEEKKRPSCFDELIILLVNRAYDSLVSYYSNQLTIDADFVSSIYAGRIRFITHYELKDLSLLYPELGTPRQNRESFTDFLDKYNRHRYEQHKVSEDKSSFVWYVFYDKFIDYSPFLNAYGKLFNKNMNIDIARKESERLKIFLKLTEKEQSKYNHSRANIIRRIKEILE